MLTSVQIRMRSRCSKLKSDGLNKRGKSSKMRRISIVKSVQLLKLNRGQLNLRYELFPKSP